MNRHTSQKNGNTSGPGPSYPMTREEFFQRCATDFGFFCETCLYIHTKDDRLIPFRLNAAQQLLWAFIRKEVERTGRLWLLLPKARQLGCSTMVAALFYWLLVFSHSNAPARALVMAQDDVTAKHMRRMYGTFWENQQPSLRRGRARSNDHEEEYSNGAYLSVRTASTVTGGRGQTFSLFHGSEVAYWRHAEEHAAGALQQIASGPGSHIVLESTAAGATGTWYERCRSAIQGQSEFSILFLPWTLEPGYSLPDPGAFTPSTDKPNALVDDEATYMQRHGCTAGQMLWRRAKIQEFNDTGADGALLFAREYPITIDEAFLSGGEDSFISPAHVAAARLRNEPLAGYALRLPLWMGLDPAPPHGPSSSVLIRRRGRIAHGIERLPHLDPEQLREHVRLAFTHEGADMLFVDESEGVGTYLVQSLSRDSVLSGKVHGVRFGERAHNAQRYPNRKTEMWDRMREWMKDATIPDELTPPGQASLASELLSVRRIDDRTPLGWHLESKKEMRTRGIASPDGADALACTFAIAEHAQSGAGTWVAGTEWEAPQRIGVARPGSIRSRLGGVPSGVYTPPHDMGRF